MFLLFLLQLLELLHSLQDDVLICFLHLPCQDVLVQDAVHLVEVEHDVQLADVAEVLVQQLHEQVDGLHQQQLVVRSVRAEHEVQPRIPAVDELVALELYKVSVVLVPGSYDTVDVILQLHALALGGRRGVPLGQPRLPLAILEQEESDHRKYFRMNAVEECCGSLRLVIPFPAQFCAEDGGWEIAVTPAMNLTPIVRCW
mmetsp:Transcript_28919/g.64205  ORF Transcript_28919/g.64205 Transcript_28919/m.64205 type:complete len:200 (+) Transcript_28919:39-638(+)